jgi:hypothetical protein
MPCRPQRPGGAWPALPAMLTAVPSMRFEREFTSATCYFDIYHRASKQSLNTVHRTSTELHQQLAFTTRLLHSHYLM